MSSVTSTPNLFSALINGGIFPLPKGAKVKVSPKTNATLDGVSKLSKKKFDEGLVIAKGSSNHPKVQTSDANVKRNVSEKMSPEVTFYQPSNEYHAAFFADKRSGYVWVCGKDYLGDRHAGYVKKGKQLDTFKKWFKVETIETNPSASLQLANNFITKKNNKNTAIAKKPNKAPDSGMTPKGNSIYRSPTGTKPVKESSAAQKAFEDLGTASPWDVGRTAKKYKVKLSLPRGAKDIHIWENPKPQTIDGYSQGENIKNYATKNGYKYKSILDENKGVRAYIFYR